MWPWLTVGNVNVPAFLLVQSLNAVLIILWARRRSILLDLPARRALDLTLVVLVAGLIGGRLLHILWEAPTYYWQNPMAVFDVLAGGYVYYGGLMMALVAGLFFLKWTGEQEKGRWFDFAAPLASLGTAIGRIGCFLAGCCYGSVCLLPWAVPVTDERGLSLLRHPTPLYSFLWEVGVLLILLGLEKTPKATRPQALKAPGSLFVVWILLHSTGRFLIEFVRDDFRGPVWFLSISQWLSICAFIGGCLVLRQLSLYPRDFSDKAPR